MFPCDVSTGENDEIGKTQQKFNLVAKNFEKVFLKWCCERDRTVDIDFFEWECDKIF